MNKSALLDKIIYYIFLALATITPLIFTTQTSELYEVPKMYFVYTLALLLLTLTAIKFITQKQIKIPTNFVVNTFALFLIIQAVSTITSTDKYTSIYGYPTRLNGGLLSQLAYFVIFITALINLNLEKAKKILEAAVFSAVAVALWGIPSYFGHDPTCFLLTGKFTSSCWQKEFDPTLRIFSTLGQPNWLASYLVLLLPLSLYKTITSKSPEAKYIFFASSIIIFLALVLTNSRAGAIGAGTAIILSLFFTGLGNLKENRLISTSLAIIFIIIIVIFGTKLTSRIKEGVYAQSQNTSAAKPVQTSLTSGGTESGQIRLIVWKGAGDIFTHWPILGSGPETFVSSYYLFRPAAHNQTSEWEFFYNKAHNEFLNYLANIGILGFLSYLAFLASVAFLSLKSKDGVNKIIFASIFGYLITIFFGFSVVATSTIFTLFAAMSVFVANQNTIKIYRLKLLDNSSVVFASLALIILSGVYFSTVIARMYFAETLIKNAQSSSTFSSLITYRNAITTDPVKNPYLLADFAYNLATSLPDVEIPDSKHRIGTQALESANEAIKIAPNNFLINQKVAKTFLLLIDQETQITSRAQELGSKLTRQAPTYPGAYITYAKIQIATNDKDGAKKTLEKSLMLKPDLPEAQDLLGQLTINK